MMELKKKEQDALQFFIAQINKNGRTRTITINALLEAWNERVPLHQGLDVTSGKRIIRYIRDNALITRLMADRHGYFVANSKVEYTRYLEMLHRRAQKVQRTYTAMLKQA